MGKGTIFVHCPQCNSISQQLPSLAPSWPSAHDLPSSLYVVRTQVLNLPTAAARPPSLESAMVSSPCTSSTRIPREASPPRLIVGPAAIPSCISQGSGIQLHEPVTPEPSDTRVDQSHRRPAAPVNMPRKFGQSSSLFQQASLYAFEFVQKAAFQVIGVFGFRVLVFSPAWLPSAFA